MQLAVKATGDARRRVVRARYGRRGRSGDPEYVIKGLLVRNLENLSAAQFANIIDTLDRDRYGQEIAAAWIAKEKLRDVLNLRARVTGSVPCERQVRDRLFAFYDWCAQHDDIPELLTLARTISRWQDEITAAVITGITPADPPSGTAPRRPPRPRTDPAPPHPSTPQASDITSPPGTRKNTRSTSQVRRRYTNSNSRPDHG